MIFSECTNINKNYYIENLKNYFGFFEIVNGCAANIFSMSFMWYISKHFYLLSYERYVYK